MSQHTAKKSLNISSAIGRRPFIAAPIAAPMIACSLIGVSRTRFGPEPVEQPLGRLEDAARRGDVLADEVARTGRAPSPARSRARPPRGRSVPPRGPPVGPELGLAASRGSGNGAFRASSVARSTASRDLGVDPVEGRLVDAVGQQPLAVRRDRVAGQPLRDLLRRAVLRRGRRASGRRAGTSRPRRGTVPRRHRARATARDGGRRAPRRRRSRRSGSAPARRRPPGRRPDAPRPSRRRSACTPCRGCSRRRTRPAASRPRPG